MAAKLQLSCSCSCSCTHKIFSSSKSSSSSSLSSCNSSLISFPRSICSSSSLIRAPHQFKLQAQSGEGDEGGLKPKGKRKFITRDEEPEQYWQTAGERKGENPMKTPLPYIIIFGMSTPFVILAIAFANGWIKVPVR